MSIGQTLSAARRQAGLSVDDVSAKTRIRATVIRALEDDDFSLCGGDFYARGHIRTIASIVGADPAALLAEYDATVAKPDDVPVASQVFEAEAASASVTRKVERRAPNWGAAAAVMVLVVVIVIAAVQLVGHNNKNNPAGVAAQGSTSQSPSPSPSPSLSTPSTPASTPPAVVSPPPSSAVAAAGVHVVLDVTSAKCWVLATSSTGQTLYQGVMNPGDSQSFDDPQRVSLRLGNAPATKLVVNGVDIGAPSSKSNVVSVSFGPGDPTQAQG